MKEYIIKVNEQKKDIMGGMPLVEKPIELVRCMNCKWYEWADSNDEMVYCKLYGRCHDWNFFCADGEPKE